MDWIQGNKFKGIVDFTYSPECKLPDDYDKLVNTFDLALLKDRNIVYTHIGYVKQLFDVIKDIDKRFVVVTHSCDCSIEGYGIRRPDGTRKTESVSVFAIPDNVVKWYSKNINMEDPRVESIPTGLENDRWFKNIDKRGKMVEKYKQPKEIRNLVYMNHTIRTNPDDRQVLYDLFENESWITAEHGSNGSRFDEYLDNIYNHKFVFCPGGNGMDSHRKWECLYMGTIPIDKKSIDNQFYQDLPICLVDNWEDVTEDFLLKEYERIQSADWNMDMLNFEYWKNKILNT